MKPLPFKMRQETAMEKYRADTWDTKEPETIAWIDSFDPHDVFFDVGANVGVYSLYAAYRFLVPRVVSFEPMRENFKALLDNIRMNKFYTIFALPIAIGDRLEMLDLDSDDHSAGASGGQLTYVTDGSKNVVACMTIDYLSSIMATFPSHVKIDIDGQELEVLKGMQNTMTHVKSILIEVSSKTRQAALDLILPHGFTTNNRFNTMTPHSRERRAVEGIDAENIIFTR